MQRIETSTEPVPKLLPLIGMAVGLWAVIGIAVTATWSASQSSPPRPADANSTRQLAYPPDLPHVPALAATQASKQRVAGLRVKQKRRRIATSAFVMHAYSARISMN